LELTISLNFLGKRTLTLKLLHQIGHLNGAHGRIPALVSGLRTSTLNGLLDCFGCNYSKYGRSTGFKRDMRDAFGNFITHVVIMSSGSADDTAKANDGIIFFGFSKGLSNGWNFKGTRNPNFIYVFSFNIMAF